MGDILWANSTGSHFFFLFSVTSVCFLSVCIISELLVTKLFCIHESTHVLFAHLLVITLNTGF